MGGIFLWSPRNRTNLNADVLRTSAATSSKTGGYKYIFSSLRGEKMQIDSPRHVNSIYSIK